MKQRSRRTFWGSLEATAAWSSLDAPEASLQTETSMTVEADPERLRTLCENHFRNAVEHGGKTVTVTVGELPDGRGFFVADDGPGIPDEEKADVFEYGYTTNTEGTGFGLSIVQQVADAHGWEIAVTDAEPTGARFEIRT